MKKLALVLNLLFFVTLFSQDKEGPINLFAKEEQFKDFLPVYSQEYLQDVVIADAVGVFDTLTVKELAVDKSKLSKFLNDQSVDIIITKIGENGERHYAPSSISVGKGTYLVVVDFLKYNTVDLTKESEECTGLAKVGVGFRMKINIENKDKSANIGNLMRLAELSKKNKIHGTISYDIIGIDANDLNYMLTFPTELSNTSIQNSFHTMALMKAKLDDANTEVYPKILSVLPSENCTSEQSIAIMKQEVKNRDIQEQMFNTPVRTANVIKDAIKEKISLN